MSTTASPTPRRTATAVSMGVDHLSPVAGVPTRTSGAEPGTGTGRPGAARTPWHRRLLVLAALASPVLMGAQYALDTAGLPREDAATYLAHVATSPERYLLSTCVYIASMACMLAGARVVALGCGRAAPRLAPLAAVVTTLGALGGMGFAGLRLTALALVEDGRVRDGAPGLWEHVQQGAPFDVLGLLLLMAILGALLSTVAMVVARRDVTRAAAPLTLVGFVLASGELPVAVSVLGGLVGLAGTWPVARAALRR